MSSNITHLPRAHAMRADNSNTRAAINGLWLHLEQARAVAACIPLHCEMQQAEDQTAAPALAQVEALAYAVAQLLTLALDEINAIELQM